MSLTAAIQISQGANCDRFTVKDVSNYVASGEAKNTFTARKLIIYKSDGTVYRQPNQTSDKIDFAYGTYPSDEITIVGLTSDLALHVVMTLTPPSVISGSIYIANTKFALVCYTKGYFSVRVKKMRASKRYEENDSYVRDTERISISSKQAVIAASADDIESAQRELNYAKRVFETRPIPQ